MGCCCSLGAIADSVSEKLRSDWLEKAWPSVEASLKQLLDAKDDNQAAAVLKSLPPKCRAEVILVSGSLKLLSARWLRDRPIGWTIQRLQDLPPEAFLDPRDAAMAFSMEGGLVVLSYGWLSKPHPDPDGFHLRTLTKYLEFHYLNTISAIRDKGKNDFGIFWDFASLPQAKDGVDRTAEEKRTFGNGLKAINVLYGAGSTTVVQLKAMPETAKEGANLTPYYDRGWCFFEEVTSGILKKHGLLLDLSLAREELNTRTGWAAAADIKNKAQANRRPSMHPDDFAVELKKRKFTNNADSEMVIEKYRQFMEEVAPTAKILEFTAPNHQGHWGPDDVRILTRALPFFIACEWLRLEHHPIGDDGAVLLADSLANLPSLKKLNVPACRIWKKGREALLAASEGRNIEVGGLEMVLDQLPSQWANGSWCN